MFQKEHERFVMAYEYACIDVSKYTQNPLYNGENTERYVIHLTRLMEIKLSN
jgi:hypothetical protein